ncbi:hypothetical protein P0828_004779 [Salmonella enterica]|nr:hypothetical protein [Salmonella enterica]
MGIQNRRDDLNASIEASAVAIEMEMNNIAVLARVEELHQWNVYGWLTDVL